MNIRILISVVVDIRSCPGFKIYVGRARKVMKHEYKDYGTT